MNNINKENLFGYQVHLYKLADEDGGGWAAEVPELPGCFSDGETPEGALVNVRDAILGWIEIAKEDGKEIPQPSVGIEPQYSGKFTVRVPKTLHKKLVEKANQENVSLNQLVNSLISYNLGYLNREIESEYKKEQTATDELSVEWSRISVKKTDENKNPEVNRLLKALEITASNDDESYKRRIAQ